MAGASCVRRSHAVDVAPARDAGAAPAWFAEEIETRYAKNAERRRRSLAAYMEASDALAAAGIEFVLLKGFTHETGFGIDGSAGAQGRRVQYDLDILTQPGDGACAQRVFERLGYAPHGAQSLSEEHARPLVRPSDWRWRGDYYDPEMPIPVELHGSAWSAERDRIHPRGMEEFWNRRCFIEADGFEIPAFAEVDRLAFAALHVLRHILRHDAKPAHVLELARFLDACEADAEQADGAPGCGPGGPPTIRLSGIDGEVYSRLNCGRFKPLHSASPTNGSDARCRYRSGNLSRWRRGSATLPGRRWPTSPGPTKTRSGYTWRCSRISGTGSGCSATE